MASMEMVNKMIKACIVSRKGGVPLHQIDKEYKDLVGEKIPYSELGYKNLEDLLKSIDFVYIKRNLSGESILQVSDPKISHIQELVSKQKNSSNRNGKYKGDKNRRRNETRNRAKPYNRPNTKRGFQSDNRANNNYRNANVNINPPRRNEIPPLIPPSRTENIGGNMRSEYVEPQWYPNNPNPREIWEQRRTESYQFDNFGAGRSGIQNYYADNSPKTYYGNPWDYRTHLAYIASKENEAYYYYQSREQMRYAEETRSWGQQSNVQAYYGGYRPMALW